MTTQVFIIRTERQRREALRWLTDAPLYTEAGHPLCVVGKRLLRRRTLPQNAYMHALFHLLAEHVGCSMTEMKHDVKEAFLPKVTRVNAITGETITEPKSTAKLDVAEAIVFIEKLHELAEMHFGMFLPPADHDLAHAAWEAAREAA